MKSPSGKLLINALINLGNDYAKSIKSCRRNNSEATVHKLRTSNRRLQAIIELLRLLHPQPRLDKFRQTLKVQLDGFDNLRDTHVLLLEIGDKLKDFPELEPLFDQLQQSELTLTEQNRAFLKTLSGGRIKRKLKKAERYCKHLLNAPDTHTAVLTAIDKIYTEALERRQAIDPQQLHSIHRFRIAMKKLRYILAAAQPMLPENSTDLAKPMQEYLTILGDIQNSAVLQETLETFYTSGIPANIQAHFQQQQQILLNTFLTRQHEVLGFWRIERDNGLPWQMGSDDWNLG
jgi:CHAD domain-containing protein